ncbi:MAG: magnesium-translocating P-type ATPase [Firmicutes bacterium]|nr:magnesium-translocating P-type ATPase [Bacillota bacterium]
MQNIKKIEKKNIFLRRISKMEINSVYWELNTSSSGLDERNVKSNICQYGPNNIKKNRKKTKIDLLIEAFVNPFTAILVFIVLISGFTDIILPSLKKEEINPVTVIIILSLVILSGLMKFIQESKSEEAIENLLSFVKSNITVRRENKGKIKIPIDNLAVGDIFYIFSGNMVPADARLIESKNLVINQASLTGESDHVERTAKKNEEDFDSPTDIPNLVFAGSNVISGYAKAIAIAIGNHTILGTIAEQVNFEKAETNFEKGLNEVSWVLIKFMLVMVPLVFFINGITKGDWLSSFIFALSVAIGLTPEMLPMIVTTCLSKGAISMSKKKTIIKKLSSIQNFGAMDVLCTDKTGTLTEDQIKLEMYITPHKVNHEKVYKYAYLNSYLQTGIKNSIDNAIINHREKNKIENFSFIDEIPFDFQRRRSSVIVCEKNKKNFMITKGAFEEIIDICTFVEFNNNSKKINDKIRQQMVKISDNFNENGTRVIALAIKSIECKKKFSTKDECDMTLIGFLTFMDPPRKSSKDAIKALRECGITVKILTGDNDKVTKSICHQMDLPIENLLIGSDIEKMKEAELQIAVEKATIFSKLTPDQKSKIVNALQKNGHVVGFMGDGVNDASAMKKSDIGISVKNAVDIAKNSADVVLMERNLMVLEKGVMEGRKTYMNMIKYIKITASSNFGNMISVLIASAVLPFIPIASLHLILLNLINDVSSMAIPWDNVNKEFLKFPRKWHAESITKFMIWNGPVSSIFDCLMYVLLYFVICPKIISNGLLYNEIAPNTLISDGIFSGINMRSAYIATFQTGWLLECVWSQILVNYVLRTDKILFLNDKPSVQFTLMSLATSIGLTILPFVEFTRSVFSFVPLTGQYFLILVLILLAYIFLATIMKKIYLRYNKIWF